MHLKQTNAPNFSGLGMQKCCFLVLVLMPIIGTDVAFLTPLFLSPFHRECRKVAVATHAQMIALYYKLVSCSHF